ncbi:alpha/beta hydrolase [Nocardia cyriacigeorgica]|nr:alpha/beta hydrolase [Nocardia cyriacigeorgica]MBF6089655.1 alpha/beta hydrolase [Nocardia cyriacigeorgica]MBF6094385.1 alpha/beta hydrolase [Nocardia cyriacigeorgica]MBF6395975.1 alpha/beta hydrolase [Nocardia cyriacigeorgica]MBF6401607.1 alpha/beta hydrolase [Nocardia cyriacigeorgica]
MVTNETSVDSRTGTRTADWQPDILGADYEQRTLDFGADPDGEGRAVATLVRHVPAGGDAAASTDSAVLYVHGFTDYFFQRHLAEHFADRGHQFYALDLRKCGRSLREGQTPHYVSDLALYDAELDEALRIIRAETGKEVLLVAHSTGGLVVPLWLDRLNRAGGTAAAGIIGLVLNSPWFDLQGPSYYRTVGTPIIHALGRFRARDELPLAKTDAYGASLHHTASGEWDYNLDWKPLHGFPVRFGWLRAIRRGHAQLHAGLDIGVPSLLLRSRLTKFARKYGPAVDVADAVLDVRQIQRWAGCLGDRTSIVPIDGARHDVFLSSAQPLAKAFEELDAWLDWLTSYRRSLAASPEAGA